jgi:hypothetical protein
MKVCILVSVTDPAYFDASTLVFDSLRVGFPTAEVEVWVNPFYKVEETEAKARAAGCQKVFRLSKEIHHGRFIADRVEEAEGPLVILDPDCYFLTSCEGWKFETQLAGFYNPPMWNDWSGCRSVDRLHTSFLWFSDPPELRRRIRQIYPRAYEAKGEYAPCDPYMPAVRFVRGEPIFWDTCANLYAMVGGTAFGPKHLACFGHLNSSSFLEQMAARLDNPKDREVFKWLHSEGLRALPRYHNLLWEVTNRYYANKATQLK